MKTRIYNEELTNEIYFMMIHLHSYYEKQLEQETELVVKGYLEHKDIDDTKKRYALAKDLLNFFREARTTYLDEMPF